MNWNTTLQIVTVAVQAVEELFTVQTQQDIAEIFDLGEEIVEKSLVIGALVAGITERVVFRQMDSLVTEDLKDRGIVPYPSLGGKFGILATVLYQDLFDRTDRDIGDQSAIIRQGVIQAVALARQ